MLFSFALEGSLQGLPSKVFSHQRTIRGGFAWGIAVPCVLFGLVLAGTGIGITLRTPGQAARIHDFPNPGSGEQYASTAPG